MKTIQAVPSLQKRLKSKNYGTSCLVAASALAALFSASPAQAILTYYIYESGSNVIVETSGSINLPSSPLDTAGFSCLAGSIAKDFGIVCSGSYVDQTYNVYGVTGSTALSQGLNFESGNTAVGLGSGIFGADGRFLIDPSYSNNTPLISSATYNNRTLLSLGFITPGLIGSWTLDGTGDVINAVVGPPTPASVPAPLPLLGAAAAFASSRRLRRRIATSRVGRAS